MHIRRSRYLRHRFPPEIISHAVWLYHRYCLSFQDVEDLLAERGIIVSYETIRQWCGKFGPDYARRLRRSAPRPSPLHSGNNNPASCPLPFKPLSVLPRQRRKTKRQPVSIPRQAWRQRTGVAGGLRIRRYLPEAVIVLGALYCAGLPIYGVTTISFTSALYIALAVVLALALMLPRPARTHLALVVVSFGTALLLAEVYFSATDRSTCRPAGPVSDRGSCQPDGPLVQ